MCRRRKLKNDAEELDVQYVDKQRGISVVLDGEGGGEDLKGNIKGLDGTEEDLSLPFDLYLKQAEYFLTKGLDKQALNRLNIALRLEPESLEVLSTRSKCNLKLGHWKAALEDAQDVLEKDTNYVKAVFCKAEALFNMCHFEYAFLGYQKGHRLAPDNDGFNLGIIKCKKTIMGTLSDEAFDFTGPVGELLKNHMDKMESSEYRFQPLIDDSMDETGGDGNNEILKQIKTNGKKKMKGSRMKADYELLKNLSSVLTPLKDEENGHSETSRISQIVDDGVQFLEERAEFWTNVK